MSKEVKEKSNNSIIDFSDPNLTQGYKKLWNYFFDLVKSDSFQNRILEVRKKYNIPEKGFPEQELLEIYNKNKDGYEDMFVEIEDICTKYALHFDDWYSIIKHYLLSNELWSNSYDKHKNLCVVSDSIEEELIQSNKHNSCISCKNRDKIYPVAIKLSPYASERDILDYVKKNFFIIKSHQEKYKNPEIKIGKVKRKKQSIQDRNNFIYENRKLSLNKIKELVKEKFSEVLDYEYIGKIKSMEIKKRKEM